MEKNKNLLINSVDLEALAKRVNNNMNLINKLFKSFIEKYTSIEEELRTYLSMEDKEEARILVHTMKGVTANLSIINLNSAAVELEKAIKCNDANKIQSSLEVFLEELKKSVSEINLYLES